MPITNTSRRFAPHATTGDELCRGAPAARPIVAARAIQAGLHARDLARREHEHRGIVDVVHVVHEHVAVGPVAAGDVRERRRAGVATALIGRVGHVVRAGAARAVVTPDVVQVEPVADLVRGRAAEVERRRRRAGGAERRLKDDHAVGRGRAAGELRVAEQAARRAGRPTC